MSITPVNLNLISANSSSTPSQKKEDSKLEKIVNNTLKLTDLTEPLISIGEFLKAEDILTLTKTCKTFKLVFNSSEVSAAGQILLAQVTGCQTLTSMRTLKEQVAGLNRYCPGQLGPGKQWTLAEVLKRYDLKTIDFSEQDPNPADARELMQAFEEIRLSVPPKESIKMESRVRDEGVLSLLASFGEDQRDQFIVFSGLLSPEDTASFQQYIALDPENHLEQQEEYHRLLDEYREAVMTVPQLKLAQLLQDFLHESQPDLNLIKKAYTQKIYGDIQVFRSCNCSDNADFFEFLRAFCPRIKTLAVCCRGEDGQVDAFYRFFTAPERRNTLIELRFLGGHNSILLNQDLIVCDREFSDYLANQGNLERFEMYRFIGSMSISSVVNHCPKLKMFNILLYNTENAEVLKLKEDALKEIADKCRNLESFEISCEFEHKEFLPLIKEIVENNKELKFLNIRSNDDAACDEFFESIFSSCPNLERLHIKNISDRFFSLIPTLLPRLKHMGFPISFFSAESIVHVLMNSPHLIGVSFSTTSTHPSVTRILRVHRLNALLKQSNCPGREILSAMKKWDTSFLDDLHHIIWVHEGMPDNQEYGRIALNRDIELLRSTKPLISLHGNLLDQLAIKEGIEAKCLLLREAIRTYVQFTEYVKGTNTTALPSEVESSMQKTIEDALVRKHGNAGDGNDYFCEAMNQDNKEDYEYVMHLLDTEIKSLQDRLVQVRRPYQKNRLQALQILLRDEKITQRQLLVIYESLDKDIQEKLAYYLWEDNQRPSEEGFGEKMIWKDVRCLLTVLERVIESL